MPRSAVASRVLAASALALLGSCSGDVNFTIPCTFHFATTGGTTYTTLRAVDMASDAPDAWKHRSKVKSIDLAGIDANVTEVVKGGGTSGTVTLWLRPDGATDASHDSQLGHWTENVPTAVPHTASVQLDASGLSLVNDALHGTGKFTVVASASTVSDTDFTTQVTLHMKLTYKVP